MSLFINGIKFYEAMDVTLMIKYLYRQKLFHV